jgi:hypothetical protein
MMPTQIVRMVCALLGLVVVGVQVNLMLHREALLGIKLGWIAAVLLLLALTPEKLPFLSGDADTCLFFRNAFAGVFVILLLFLLFVIFGIQLPKERVPRFEGTVVALVDTHGASVPCVQFHDAAGKPILFEDALATTIFPKHTFVLGERVVVRAPTSAPPHVDHSTLARWCSALFLLLIVALVFSLVLTCHLRYLTLISGR